METDLLSKNKGTIGFIAKTIASLAIHYPQKDLYGSMTSLHSSDGEQCIASVADSAMKYHTIKTIGLSLLGPKDAPADEKAADLLFKSTFVDTLVCLVLFITCYDHPIAAFSKLFASNLMSSVAMFGVDCGIDYLIPGEQSPELVPSTQPTSDL